MGVIPPLTGVAVKVTLVPVHMAPAGTAAILTLTGKLGFTVMLMVLEFAGLPVAQVALEVSSQVTASRFDKVVEVKVTPVAALLPFTFHW